MRLPGRLGWLAVWALAATAALAMAGCVGPQTRAQAAEEQERDKDLDVLKIYDVVEVGNVYPLQVSGVGLVTGLDGAGYSPAGFYRKMLEEQLHKQGVERVKEVLDDPNNALVLVSALLRDGTRKGDLLDVEVTLPPGSKATSLRGGYLHICPLRPYETAQNIDPEHGGKNLLSGHVLAHAKGPLLVGLGTDDPAEQCKARLWAGGVSHTDRPYAFALKKDAKFAKVAYVVAERINVLFQDDHRKQQEVLRQRDLIVLDEVTQSLNKKFEGVTLSRTTAKAVNPGVVFVNLPYSYRLNKERYMHVAMLIPLQEAPEQQARYRSRLKKMLNQRAETIRAALRLEALGQESVPVLKEALQGPDPLVRFSAAESLAYLGNTAGCEALSRLAAEYPDLQALCLKALASLDDSVSRLQLANLLATPSPPLRCGAFRALRLSSDGQEERARLLAPDGRRLPVAMTPDARLGGELVGGAFWLHRVAPNSPQLVNFTLHNRAEIVLFGDDIVLTTPVKIRAGAEFTITAARDDDRCTVTRFFSQQGRQVPKQCTLRLQDVLRTLAELGGRYTDAVDFLRRADDQGCLPCPVRVDALPEELSVEELVQNSRDPAFLRTEGGRPRTERGAGRLAD